MNANVATVNIAALAPRPKPIEESIYIGKDVLELLTGSMYADPLSIYREYVQNAADSIDEARTAGLPMDVEPDVLISINHTARSVRIRDCGMSIPAHDFVRKLTTIGASGKRGQKRRGFRGVGRLSGLGYCQELIFRGRAEGESKVSELHWDGRILRDKLRDASFHGGLAEIVSLAVTHTKFASDEYPARFFEVEMRKVQRLRKDLLLNEVEIRSYLSQVAPVAFSPDFQFGRQIQEHLDSVGVAKTVNLKIDGDDRHIFHRATNDLRLSDRDIVPIDGIEMLNYYDSDGELVATGWMARHPYKGAFPKKYGACGIRLRTGNVQVGSEDLIAHLFPELRFAYWAMGDIHVVSPKIVPNGRRDEFEPNIFYTNFQSDLSLTAKKIAQDIRGESIRRNRNKRVRLDMTSLAEWVAHAKTKNLPPKLRDAVSEVAVEKLAATSQAIGRLEQDSAEKSNAEQELAKLKRSISKGENESNDERRRHNVDSTIQVVLKTILSNARTPSSGIALATQVINAFEAPLKRVISN